MTKFRADPEESFIEVEMQSNVHPVQATGRGVYGYVEAELDEHGGLDTARPHRARLALWVDELDSGNEVRDVEMLRRLDARRYPTIEWVVSRAWADGRRQHRAVCEVTVHGETQAFEGDFSFTADGDRVLIDGEHSFDMRDFGLSPPRFFWLWMEAELTVRMHVVARPVVATD